MKKLMFSFLIVMFMVPCLVNAKSYCKIVSGDGTKVGDEIKCGDENFYIIDNSSDNYKLLAKYNLDIGLDIERIDVTDKLGDSYVRDYCYDNYAYHDDYEYYSYRAYNYVEGYDFNDRSYCIVGDPIDTSKIAQSEKAIGAHGTESGKPASNERGIIMMSAGHQVLINFGSEYNDGYMDGVINPTSNLDATYNLYNYLNQYVRRLRNDGYDIKDINLITVKEISNIVKSATGNELSLSAWWNNHENWAKHPNIYSGYGDTFLVGSIKDKLNGKYPWLYSTTYWTRTAASSSEDSLYFVDTLGNLCNTQECFIAIGAGVRPVITLNKKDIVSYVIKTNIRAGKGSIQVVGTANGGDSIKFKVIPEAGYKLVSLTITSEDGNKITYRKVNENTVFTMPNEDVLIEAEFIKNPVTGTPFKVLTFIAIILIGISIYQRRTKVLKQKG